MINQSRKKEKKIDTILITHHATADIQPDDKQKRVVFFFQLFQPVMGQQEENEDPRKRVSETHLTGVGNMKLGDIEFIY